MTNWFVKNKIQNQDEIVIQFLNEGEKIYRITKEKNFVEQIKLIENKILETTKEYEKKKLKDIHF